MALVENIRDRVTKQKEAFLIIGIFALIQLVIYSAVWNKPMGWDSSIYVAMGKHLFSMGEVGLWEVFRPPLIPAVVGVIWKTSLPVIPFSRLMHLTLTLAGTTVAYKQLKQIFDYRTAVYAVSVMLATSVFIENTTNLLTGIISALMVLISLNMYLQDKYIFSGFLSGLAFLTRFPAILISPAIAIYETAENYGAPREAFTRLFKYAIPVAALIGAYLGLNAYLFGDPLTPITSGLSVPPSDATSIFGTYYLTKLAVNPLTILFIPSLILIFRKRAEKFYPYIAAFAVYFIFFESYPHKEVRYSLLFLPFISVVSAYGLKEIQDRLSLKKEVIVVAATIVMIISAIPVYNASSYQNPNAKQFYQQFESLNGTIATNTPGPIQYGDFNYRALPQGYLDSAFGRPGTDYYGINSCAWYNTEGQAAEEINQLNSNLSQYGSIYNDSDQNCNYMIYKVEN
jgi:hypothetical protein